MWWCDNDTNDRAHPPSSGPGPGPGPDLKTQDKEAAEAYLGSKSGLQSASHNVTIRERLR